MSRFPVQEMVEAVMDRYFLPEGRRPEERYRQSLMHTHRSPIGQQNLDVLAAFVEVTLARDGHQGLVGINLLTKVQLPTVPTLFGAMLGGVNCVLMGAGIPRPIPGVLDALAERRRVTTTLDIIGADRDRPPTELHFDPARFGDAPRLVRPAFLPIVASHVLATSLMRKSTGSIEGFIVEGPAAGGHNAPPRGMPVFDPAGQPVYGARYQVDFETMSGLGVPFWIAGNISEPAHVGEAIESGAAGVQVGTLFAFCAESGMDPPLRRHVLDLVRQGAAHVHTDAHASPTGFPFKVVAVPGTTSEADVYEKRERICDLGYLREAYSRPDGSIGYRCASEPVEQYVAKGGRVEDTVGRKCLCNGLTATNGLAQIQKNGSEEPPIVTSGDALHAVGEVLGAAEDYNAKDVIAYMLGSRHLEPVAATPR